MEIKDVVPPGDHRHDPWKKELDPLMWAVNRSLMNVEEIGELWHSFQTSRASDPERADQWLRYINDCQKQALQSLQRLTGLLLAGYTRDPSKRVSPHLLNYFARLDAAEQRFQPKQDDGSSHDELQG